MTVTAICLGGPYDGHVEEIGLGAASIRFDPYFDDDGYVTYYMGTSEIDPEGRRIYRYVA